MKLKIIICSLSLFLFFHISVSYACTTFCIKTEDELVFGRNYDFMIGYGLVLVNKKDVVKSAFTVTSNPVKWVSKYGSVTFNQFGREFPTGGINEAGLVVELMWLDETKYSGKDDRPATGGILQWIQYQLDNCETIQEVIDTDKEIRIPSTSVPLHFLITDRYGNTATIEFLNGKLVSNTSETMKYRVLTNDTYEKSVNYLEMTSGSAKTETFESERSSLDRFVKACSMTQKYNKITDGNAVDYGFKILNDVSQGSSTKWSIVYDIKNMKIYFKTYDNDKLKNIDIASLDFNCSAPVKMLDVNHDYEGNVNGIMSEYTYEANRKLIEDSYNGVEFLQGVSTKEKDITAKYPEDMSCRSKSEIRYNFPDNNLTKSKDTPQNLIYILSGVILVAVFFTGYKIKNNMRHTK